MKITRQYHNGKKKVEVALTTSNMTSKSWESITDQERDKILGTLQQAEKDIVLLRQRIKLIPVKKTKTLKPGLSSEEVRTKVSEWFSVGLTVTGSPHKDKFYWDSLYIHERTGQLVYTKYMGDPEDDGYVKGFQLALDIHTNEMVARNCDNIWLSMEKRGFKRLESVEHFKKHYKEI